MEHIIYIVISLAVASLVYLGFVLILRKENIKRYFTIHWFLHPNAICFWRLLIGLSGMLLYFIVGQKFWGIFLFTHSAMLDGVDGLVARSCNLITIFGEEIDPLCDKLTYLPPMVIFAHQGLLDIDLIWTLVIIEILGQFAVRYIIKRFTSFSVGANNFGKIKAVLCFALIVYCALLDGALEIPDFTRQILYVAIILAVASSVFKTIPNRFYADILSILNLSCGIIGIVLVFQGRYVTAAISILTGQIFDLFDGRMAEKHGGTRMGPWLDDIADLVSFGMCPGLLILMQGRVTPVSFLFGIIYFLSVGFRLYRYLIYDKYDEALPSGLFNGLPSPAGAIMAMGAALFWENLWISRIVILFCSFLLISHIRFVHFGRVVLREIPRTFIVLLGFIIVFIIAYMIKVKDAEILGALLLMSFLVYAFISSRLIMRP
ncbi:MAG: CDP-alcohol phosphatidyltransferase family protein [Deltaproteobacteria bacterium]|nr:CDP-alcohol phosphatidyltransferase family protein [Deltaproteobacteria bacterium]